MPFTRGDIYRVLWDATDLGERKYKYIVILQSAAAMDANATNIAYVVCSTDRTGGHGPRGHEVRLLPEDADCFDRSTIVDGRWVYTEPRDDILGELEGVLVGRLDDERMMAVDVAVFIGLQLDP